MGNEGFRAADDALLVELLVELLGMKQGALRDLAQAVQVAAVRTQMIAVLIFMGRRFGFLSETPYFVRGSCSGSPHWAVNRASHLGQRTVCARYVIGAFTGAAAATNPSWNQQMYQTKIRTIMV